MFSIFKLKKISTIIYFLAFIFSLVGLFFLGEKYITIYKFEFSYDKINAITLLIVNFILFLFNFASNKSIKINKKMSELFSVFLLIFTNAIILTDNIILFLSFLFIFFLLSYFLNRSKTNFTFDCIIIFMAFVFLSWGLIRYFVLNNIAITFSNVEQYKNVLFDFDLSLAFFAFLLLISRLYNFIPFNLKSNSNCLYSVCSIIYFAIGSNLFVKIYPIFLNSFQNLQNVVGLYLIFNVIYYTFLQFKSKKISEFLKYSLSANIAIGIFNLFLFNEYALSSFYYYFIAMIFSYGAGFLLADIIKSKIGTYAFSDFKKIGSNDKTIKVYALTVFLNIAKIPFFVGFFAFLNTFVNIFLIGFQSKIMMLCPYVLFGCAFLLSLNTFNVIAKILAEPLNPIKSFLLNLKQNISMMLVCIAILLSGVGVQFIMEQLFKIIQMGNI